MHSGMNGAPLDVVRATCTAYKTVTWRVYLSKQLLIGYILLYSSVASKYDIMRLRALLNIILNAIFVHCATPPFHIQRYFRNDENTMCPVCLHLCFASLKYYIVIMPDTKHIFGVNVYIINTRSSQYFVFN